MNSKHKDKTLLQVSDSTEGEAISLGDKTTSIYNDAP